jgi:hypothetical protein
MVIVMMGYNDKPLLKPNKFENLFNRTLGKVKVFRLFNSLLQKLAAHADPITSQLEMRLRKNDIKTVAKPNDARPVPENYALALLYAIQLEEQKEYNKAALILENLTQLDLDKLFIDRVWHELGKCFYEQEDYKRMIFVAAHNLSLDPVDAQATEHVRSLCKKKVEEEEMLGMLSGLVERNPTSIPLNGFLAVCYADYGHKDKADFYFKVTKRLETQGVNAVLKNNYQKLHEILKEHGIKQVFVQYPNRDIKALQELFGPLEDYKDIIFVENKANFRPSMDHDRYDEFFIDRAATYFGHGTPYGNYLLASSIGESILEYLQ